MRKKAGVGLLVTTALIIGWPAKADETILTKNCTALGGLARSIMEKRQSGTDMSEMMAVVENYNDESFKPIVRSMVMMAYSMPRYNGDEFQQKTISDFSNQIQLSCYQLNSQ